MATCCCGISRTSVELVGQSYTRSEEQLHLNCIQAAVTRGDQQPGHSPCQVTATQTGEQQPGHTHVPRVCNTGTCISVTL
eukprot:351395-Chlamydomonas_euryale.AAC.13